MPTRPQRSSLSLLPDDPKERAYIEYRRRESAAAHAMNSLPTSDFRFLIGGKPKEPVIPEGSSAIETAILRQEPFRKFATYAQNHGYPDTDGLSLDEAFESCLLHLIQSYPAVKWREVIEWLNAEQPEYAFIPSVQRALTLEESLVHAQRLANDLDAHTQLEHGAAARSNKRRLLNKHGVDPDEVLAKADVAAVEFNVDSVEAMRGRLAYYREELQVLTTERFLFDERYDLAGDISVVRLSEVIDAYSDALNELTGGSSQESEESDHKADIETHEVEPEPPEAPVSADRAESERLALELAKAAENGAEKLAEASYTDREYLTPHEVADMLGRPVSTITRYLRDGKIPASKPGGGRWIIRRSELEQDLKNGRWEPKVRQNRPPITPLQSKRNREKPNFTRPDGSAFDW